MTEHDKELEDYLRGDSRVSQAYRAASDEKAPAHLDEAILAQARAELRRKPSWDRVLAPVALAATMVLGVNLAWNLYQVEPMPEAGRVGEVQADRTPKRRPDPATPALEKKESRASAVADEDVLESPAPANSRSGETSAMAGAPSESLGDRALASRSMAARSEAESAPPGATSAARAKAREADAPTAFSKSAPAPSPAASEIESLIAWVQKLDGAVFIVDGEEFTPPQAAVYLRIQWREAGDRVHTAEDFIQKCAHRSPVSGNPYRFRFADGTVRDAAEVLREQLP